MEIKFLRMSPPQALNKLESAMASGYQMIDIIRTDFQKNQSIADQKFEEWKKQYFAWVNQVLVILQEVYYPISKAFYFRDAKTTRYAKTGDVKITGIEQAVEVRMEIIKEYSDFILNQSHPSITINGNLNFQVGEKLSNNQS